MNLLDYLSLKVMWLYRAGEVATASYGQAYWDDIENTLKTEWSMEKVSEQK